MCAESCSNRTEDETTQTVQHTRSDHHTSHLITYIMLPSKLSRTSPRAMVARRIVRRSKPRLGFGNFRHCHLWLVTDYGQPFHELPQSVHPQIRSSQSLSQRRRLVESSCQIW